MSVEQILKKYEQDTCEYCHGKKILMRRKTGIGIDDFVEVWIDDDITVATESYIFCKHINYCPMCGRKLSDE